MTVAEVQHSVITDEIQLAYLITYLQIYHDNNLLFWPENGIERKKKSFNTLMGSIIYEERRSVIENVLKFIAEILFICFLHKKFYDHTHRYKPSRHIEHIITGLITKL